MTLNSYINMGVSNVSNILKYMYDGMGHLVILVLY